jgi:exodeoxyribonuclease VII small subunit
MTKEPDSTTTPPARTFELLLEELQETVRSLDEEHMTLEETVKAYERSVAIATECGRMLDEAELRVSRIDADSRELREQSSAYHVEPSRATLLFLGEDEDDLSDLLDSEE